MAVKPGTAVDLNSGICTCGCGEETRAKSRFRPGHDQRLKGQLKRAHLADAKVLLVEGRSKQQVAAIEAAARLDQTGHGWVKAVEGRAIARDTGEDQEAAGDPEGGQK